MRIVMFCHSLVSDWNHGNAHFLRGIVTELLHRGHDVAVYEPRNAWSVQNLIASHGRGPLHAFRSAYPSLRSHRYDVADIDLDAVLDGADLVLVHEWNEPSLVARIGAVRAAGAAFRLLFHDTHHRAITAPAEMRRYDLRDYDGVLAFGDVIRDAYLERGWTRRAWTWHEAADIRVFRPLPPPQQRRDLVWIGNWGDGERSGELIEFLIDPVRALGILATIHGVRYPDAARAVLGDAGIECGGWLPNFEVPRVFAGHRVTVHIPRRPYATTIPGVPTIRPFEALACGIPLISAPWEDTAGLFRPGTDHLVARSGREMQRLLADVLNDDALAASLRDAGLRTILERHTCAHRIDELLAIHESLSPQRQESVAQ